MDPSPSYSQDPSIQPPYQVPEPPKQRHGCVTAWLVLMILFNSLAVLGNLMLTGMVDEMQQEIPNFSAGLALFLALLGAANVAFAVALFNWKKWGFYGFLATSLVAVVINLYMGLPIGQALAGLLGVAILWAVLQIGDRSAWKQLE